MELSGEDAVLVLADADLDLVVRALRFGTRLNDGETCIAPRRLVVMRVDRGRSPRAPFRTRGVPPLPLERVRDEAAPSIGRTPATSRSGASIFSRDIAKARATRGAHQDRLRPHQRSHRPDCRSAHAVRRREGQRLRHHARRRGACSR